MIEILEFFLKSRVKKTKFEIIVYYRQKKKEITLLYNFLCYTRDIL